jgi:hypothetical protein
MMMHKGEAQQTARPADRRGRRLKRPATTGTDVPSAS